jgi:hypothetical protein
MSLEAVNPTRAPLPKAYVLLADGLADSRSQMPDQRLIELHAML